MWIEGHLSTIDDWGFGINRNDGFDPELDMTSSLSYFTISLFLFSISFVWKNNKPI